MFKQIEILVDDLDQTSEADTYHFKFEDKKFEIDLHPEHHAELEKSLEAFSVALEDLTRFLRVARPHEPEPEPEPVGPEPEKAAAPAPKKSRRKRASDAEVRAWALENKVEVGKTGRVPKHIHDAYRDAH